MARLNQQVQQCMASAAQADSVLTEYAINKLLDQQITNFYNKFSTQCMEKVKEHLSYTYISKEYHYTLYYYDQAGSLVQTVPPQGVHPLTTAEVNNFIKGTKTEPGHTLVTQYRYNSLNQLTGQHTPDAGQSRFWYNNKGQLKLSQNAQQAVESKYSYSRYDDQGRITEVGEMVAADQASILAQLDLTQFPVATTYSLTDVTTTHYDNPNPMIQSVFAQSNLRSRVAWVEVTDATRTDTVRTYYTYDIHGNVRSLLQNVPGLEPKRTDYNYDLVSGKVNYVMYQYGHPDQFIHRYRYDADNRIISVETSSDGFIWDKDASYQYYLHGPLARTELGPYRAQGLDYYYTLQGWIKGVNMPYSNDPGADGINGAVVGKDVFAYSLGYYNGDYAPINNSVTLSDSRDQLWPRLLENIQHSGLYNGNISWMTTDLAAIGVKANDRTKGMQAMLPPAVRRDGARCRS